MKKRITIFLLLICNVLHSMDTTQEAIETVPVKLQDLHSKEQRKFKRYHLEQPEIFITIMRGQFNYENNKEHYLKNVQTLASGLLAQHQAMLLLGERAYFASKFYKIKDEFFQILNKLHSKVLENDIVIFTPETAEQLNIVLAHSDIIRIPRIFSEQELAVIFSWIIDTTKGQWLNNLGLLAKNMHEGMVIDKKNDELGEKFENSIAAIPGTPFNTSEQLIKDNTPYVTYILQEMNNVLQLQAKNSSSDILEKANRVFIQNNAQIAQLYRIHQNEYQKLYEIILKELKNTYQEMVLAKQKVSPLLLLPIPEKLRKENAIPARFPDKLETIKNPATYLTTFSLDSELEKARQEWEKRQAQEPTKKKYIKPRKKITPTSFQAASTKEIAEPAETAVVKIRTGTDDSYVAEGAEDDLKVIIEDPKNDATITLFKTKMTPENTIRLKKLPRKEYTPNVKRWFDNPEKARVEQGYTDPKNPKYRAGEPAWKPIVLHAFSRLVDDYAHQYGTVGEINSRIEKGKKDILLTVPGKLEYPDGTEETGVFAYIIDSKTGHWYHRMFTPYSNKNIISDLFEKGYFAPEMKGYYDVFFPPLSSATKS